MHQKGTVMKPGYRLLGIGHTHIVTGIAGAFLLLAIAGSEAQNSPAGSWDCVISGARHGLAYLTFSDEEGLSFSGLEAIVPAAPGSKPPQLVNSIIPFPPDTSSSGSQIFTVPTSAGVQAFLVQEM